MAEYRLVSIGEATRHLRIDNNAYDIEDVTLKVVAASGIVLNYLKDPLNEEGWDENTTPSDVKAAVLFVLGTLYRVREGDVADPLSQTVRDILHRYRDPAIA